MDDILKIINRNTELFTNDVIKFEKDLISEIKGCSFLVIGGGGSIGQAVTKEIFRRNPKKLHVVDLSENNLVELVRDLRSSFGYISGDFRTFALDCGSIEFSSMFENEGPYDYVLNLAALKHVRSEQDQWTLMRMIDVNIRNAKNTIELAQRNASKKYFCVSTDKAANPVNMMGASKRVMEMFLINMSDKISISTSRFANVAFSDGSLLQGFIQRIAKKQPIAAPNDISRYFVTPRESGILCLLSTILGQNSEIFFPKLGDELRLVTLESIAISYLNSLGFEPLFCSSEEEAREAVCNKKKLTKAWPVYFSKTNTTGEKEFEQFFTEKESVDFQRFKDIGIVLNTNSASSEKLNLFLEQIDLLRRKKYWARNNLIELFQELLPDFLHLEKNRYLDQKM